MIMESQLKEKVQQLGLDLNDRQLEQFESYYHMVVEKNKVMNLTAITDHDDFTDKHFADSLSIVKCLDMEKISTVIDVGTGAGFPGIPLKIAFSHLEITLLYSLNKRVRFLNESAQMLDLKDVYAVHGRAEDIAHKKEYREHYDLCVSRAVANLSTLSEYCLPFVKVGGIFAAYKSGNVKEEVLQAEKAIKLLGGEILEEYSFNLPGTDIERTFILIKKVKATGNKYPRKAGLPSKEPL